MDKEVYSFSKCQLSLENLITSVSPIEFLRFSLIALKYTPMSIEVAQNKNKHKIPFWSYETETKPNHGLKTMKVSNKFP